ncbi:MAG: CRISPR-associated protein Cas4 [Oscillospiraceae bacterium]|nr:CRISPR-associated protein Cas4 [Oscillospiraceae bacterium]
MNIRAIQHYMYCPRRFGLLEINKDWNENAFVVNAELIHEHVHDGSHHFSDHQKVVRSSIDVYNNLPEYDLYGILDCVEFVRNKNGVAINGLEGTYKVRIVEYKPKAPKDAAFHETDAIQVFAQKICADFVWKCNSEAVLYYANTRKRIVLPFDESYELYDTLLKKYLSEMRAVMESHTIPTRKKGQKCSGCSLSDICFSKEKKYNVKDIVMSMKGVSLS